MAPSLTTASPTKNIDDPDIADKGTQNHTQNMLDELGKLSVTDLSNIADAALQEIIIRGSSLPSHIRYANIPPPPLLKLPQELLDQVYEWYLLDVCNHCATTNTEEHQKGHGEFFYYIPPRYAADTKHDPADNFKVPIMMIRYCKLLCFTHNPLRQVCQRLRQDQIAVLDKHRFCLIVDCLHMEYNTAIPDIWDEVLPRWMDVHISNNTRIYIEFRCHHEQWENLNTSFERRMKALLHPPKLTLRFVIPFPTHNFDLALGALHPLSPDTVFAGSIADHIRATIKVKFARSIREIPWAVDNIKEIQLLYLRCRCRLNQIYGEQEILYEQLSEMLRCVVTKEDLEEVEVEIGQAMGAVPTL